MSKKILIIGKHSKIVQSSFKVQKNIVIVSHGELENLDFEKFSTIIVFSWSFKQNEDNINLAKKIPIKKVIFISSHSVLSLQLRKQISQYPNNKKILEDFYLKNGGSVLRIASTEDEVLKKMTGTFASTNKYKLAEYLIKYHELIKKKKITNFYSINSNTKNYLIDFLNNITLFLDKVPLLKLLIFGFIKFVLKSPKNNYTSDCNKFFLNKVQIGYGALGPSVRKLVRPNLIFVSPLDDKVLNEDGFRNLYLGYKYNGLAKYWHGVKTFFDNQDRKFIVKKTALIVPRSRFAFLHRKMHIQKLIKHDNCYELICLKDNKSISYFSNEIHLAAGWLENSRLISQFQNVNLKFSDDENAYLGTVDTDEMIKNKLCRKVGPFLISLRNKYFKCLSHDFFIEPRPFTNKIDIDFYKNSTTNIFIKLIHRFKYSLLNEAIYNKFGFSLYTKKMNVFIQILYRGNIALRASNSKINRLVRKRIPSSSWDLVKKLLKKDFDSIQFAKKIITTDGIHVLANKTLSLHKKNCKNIFIYGPPKAIRKDCLHTTYFLRDSF